MIDGGEVSGKYFSDQINIVDQLYAPSFKWATKYVRDAGYFSSHVYQAMSKDVLEFVLRSEDNHITLITCIDVYPSDFDAIVKDNSKSKDEIISELNRMLDDDVLADPVKMLAAIVATGQMTVYVSLRKREPGSPHSIDHSKSGYFSDETKVRAFDGSMNETYPAVIPGLDKGHKEHFNIYDSLELTEKEWNRWAAPIKQRLDNDCSGSFPKKSGEGTIIVEIDSISREQLPSMNDEDWDPQNHRTRAAERSDEIYQLFESVIEQKQVPPTEQDVAPSGKITLRPHQKEGLKKWEENGSVGILEHATGSGKTITALTKIIEHSKEGFPVLILVPGRILLDQWVQEIEKFVSPEQINVLRVGSGYKGWKNEISLQFQDMKFDSHHRITVAIIHSARTEEFLSQISGLKSSLLVVDECHRIGAPSFRGICELKPAKVLGLSATPKRYGDPDGTDRMKSLCGEIIHKYTLSDALKDDFLTPYTYNIERVRLTDEHPRCIDSGCQDCERSDYDNRMEKIIRELNRFRNKDGNISWDELPKSLKISIVQAKKIIKKAREKSKVCAKIIFDNYGKRNSLEHWLVYCEDSGQLEDVQAEINKIGIEPVYVYWSGAQGAEIGVNERLEFARKETLRLWEITGGIMLSIACLDEGVNIERISHGIILASSNNPRQFIQRRGRMLRLHPNKTLARIWDTLVIPESIEDGEHNNFVLNEINRAALFAKDSSGGSARQELTNIRFEMGLDDYYEDGTLDGSGEDDDE